MIELEKIHLPIDQVPEGTGWNIESGNNRTSTWWRVTRSYGDGEVLLHTEHFVGAVA